MTNNDILRRLRYALDLNDTKMVAVFALDGFTTDSKTLRAMMLPEEEEGAVICSPDILEHFLDGLIVDRRGPRDPNAPVHPATELTNNQILKKIRIALTLHESDMLKILKLGEHPMSKGELSALFRRTDNKHFRRAGGQVLRKFLKGLTTHLRPYDVLPDDDEDDEKDDD